MNKEEVKKIYRLANLSLDGKDVELLSDKFNIVIDFIEDIFTVDTNNVEMTELISNHKAVFRKDKPLESISRSEALENAKDTEYGYFRLDWKL
ncbi:Asp-tRNA(Asn)/Glu-tRNA(Gln) amidotransferase subunit GatC [Anaerococcus tetradius]|uniref:Aspartyl/glutamyl-tRNA(Asn/Gln) amidotransferase, C subunit n=1 Tax=Anaerococcus tetradius ATCC 35098 TaxID=525255 RepID=C2CFI5_9FIRM|nr:Asp-tRNA(Asn)/Glu-tRNA(Gln) amidotransferase subunit GatC [Anaerococcus tetradius]EEI83633.1 aspartyl/glutamyl-tRNA(Asn/Gln) amidotransferase, C subunit [Anaerococcus tetradius ATCC 35098]